MPIEVLVGSKCAETCPVSDYPGYVLDLQERMQTAHDVAREHLKTIASRQKQDYDAKSCLTVYQPGDLVWYASELKQLRITPKLRSPYAGPFVILESFSPLNYLIQLDGQGTKKFVHHNKLKPYLGNQPFPWVKSLRKCLRKD